MKLKIAGCWTLAVLLAGAGCARKTSPAELPATVTLVPKAERSRHFEAVNRHLDLGGTLYIYADIDGDAAKLATTLNNMMSGLPAKQPGAAFLNQDYRKLFADLGLGDIKALGLSSVAVASGGFRNRMFFYTPDGRHGLLAGLGGKPAPFIYTKMVPADVDFYSESELDLPAIYSAIKKMVAGAAGQATAETMEQKLREAGRQAGFSLLSLIENYRGRSVVILCLDPKKHVTLPLPKPITIPAISLLLRIDGIGPSLEGALTRLPLLVQSKEGDTTFFAFKQPLPIPGIQPVFAIKGSALFFATSRQFLTACMQRQHGLDQNPAFQRALAAVGPDGNGLSYVSPEFFARLRELVGLNPDAQPAMKRALKMLADQSPSPEWPLVAVRTNLPDGILVRSHSNRSLKQTVAVAAMYNPVTMGIMAAMAIPAFQKVRRTAQAKTVLNNLRMLGAAAAEYYLEHGVNTATYDDLVGPGKFIPRIKSVAGENYRKLRFKQGQPLVIRLPDGRVIRYQP